ncbi:ABC transporter permease [Fluviibacterium sp. DFM31]|uniref:Transport permease protein n=2 Tax=Meridianimarinicoccus marinus TaxID=3231483 RepID=A0ABV3L2Y8_9RHOB
MMFDLRTPRVISALVLREMSTTYGRSAAGYLWAVAEPVAGIAILTAAFSFMLRDPPIGNSFALFYATGLLPFLMYMGVSGKVSQAIQFSRPLLSYPRLTFLDAVFARFLLNAITQLVVAFSVLGALLLAQDTRPVIDFGAIFLSFAMALSFAFGIGALNCLLFAFLPSWQMIWAVMNRPSFLISGIFFTYDSMPAVVQKFLWFNPLIHVIGQMRKGVYPTYSGVYVTPWYVFLCAAIPAVAGIFFLRRYHKKILNEM